MDEYIKRSTVLNVISGKRQSLEAMVSRNYAQAVRDVHTVVCQISTVDDVVEIVRCKECGNYCENTGECNLHGHHPKDNDFCSYGKRKDGGSNA